MLLANFDRCLAAERIMGTSLVVLDHPPVGGLAKVFDAQEQVRIENLLAERPVEAFDVGVLVGLSRLDVMTQRFLLRSRR